MAIDRVVAATSRVVRLGRVVPAVFLAVFFAWPVIGIFTGHLRPAAIADVLGDRSMREVAWFTLWQATASTAIALAVGLPLTWSVSRWRFPGSRTIAGLVGSAFLIPSVIMATGVAAIVSARGIPAILWAHVSFNTAVVLRMVGPTWSMVDQAQLETAASLGAGPWRVTRDITWPSISPAVRNAAAVVFSFCFTSFAIVSILGGPTIRTLETEVFTRAVRLGDFRTATAVSFVQMCAVWAVLFAGRGRPVDAIESSDITGARPLGSRLRWRLGPPLVALVGATVVAAPLVAVMLRSVRLNGEWTSAGWRALFDGSLQSVGIDVGATLRTTAAFAATTATLAVVLALASCRRAGPSLFERISIVPLMTSAVTLGLGILVTFNSPPFDWRGRAWLIPVVHTVIALPLAVRVVAPALRAIGSALLESAADLGAGPVRTWWTIEVPLLRPALLRAAGISAAVSVGEFGATSFLTRGGTMTVPIAIDQLMGRPGGLLQQAAFALATLTAVATAAVLSRA